MCWNKLVIVKRLSVWRCWGGLGGRWNFVCVLGGFENRWGQGEGVKSGYSTKGLIAWTGLARFAEIPAPKLNATKINFAIIWQPSQPAWIAGIPVLWRRDPRWKSTPCAVGTIIFQRKILNYLIVCFTQTTLFFQKVGFLLPICLPCVICGTYETKINAVLWHSARKTFASFGLIRSHVLRASCNFESKQANSITLFGRRPNNKSIKAWRRMS